MQLSTDASSTETLFCLIRVQWPEVVHKMTFSTFSDVVRKISKYYWIVDSYFGLNNYLKNRKRTVFLFRQKSVSVEELWADSWPTEIECPDSQIPKKVSFLTNMTAHSAVM